MVIIKMVKILKTIMGWRVAGRSGGMESGGGLLLATESSVGTTSATLESLVSKPNRVLERRSELGEKPISLNSPV